MSNEMVVEPASPTGLSQIERVVDTFVAPSKTFRDILRNTSWWLPLIIMILSTLTSAYVIDKEVGFDQVYANSLRQSPKSEDRLNQLQPAQKANAVKVGVTVTKYITYSLSAILVVATTVYALILWASFNFGLGAQTTFPQVLAVSFYATLPYLLLTILTVSTLHFGANVEAFDPKNPVGTNLAYFMPDASPMVKALLAPFDLIKLWSVALQIVGMSIIAKKSMTQSAVIVGIFWLLGVGVGLVGALFS